MEEWMETIIDAHWKHIAFRPRWPASKYKEGTTLSCSCTEGNFLLVKPVDIIAEDLNEDMVLLSLL